MQIGLAGPSEKRIIRKEATLDMRLFIILKVSMSWLVVGWFSYPSLQGAKFTANTSTPPNTRHL